MKTLEIPSYQLDTQDIQELLTQTTMTAVGDTQGSTQECKIDEVRTEFKVPEGEKRRIKKMFGLEDTA